MLLRLKPFTSCSSRPSSRRIASLFTPRRFASTRGVVPLWLQMSILRPFDTRNWMVSTWPHRCSAVLPW
uniref:Uncharacterized protein n=1 Tax=Anguilla anguilla TaxID=7936 RepID=A0A0E9PHW2_ANGAN